MKKALIAATLSVVAGAVFLTRATTAPVVSPSNDIAPAESFRVGKDGRLLIVPVHLNGREVQFLIDTGAAKTAIDSTLRSELGTPIDSVSMETSAGPILTEHFACPHAVVGKQDLRIVETVMRCDLTPVRYATGNEVYGILGMDFLRKFAVEFDFDEGTVRLFHSAPAQWTNQNEKVALTSTKGGAFLMAEISGRSEPFLIDTGANVSYLTDGAFDALVRTGNLSECGVSRALTIGGNVKTPLGYVSGLRLGSFAHESIRMSRDSMSGLGLQYLSRYHILCDFPNEVVFLRKGVRYSRPESIATSGMGVIVVNGRKTVGSVEAGGAAARSGVQMGDTIVAIDGKPSESTDMHDFGELLTSEVGRRVSVEVMRDGRSFPIELSLQSRF